MKWFNRKDKNINTPTSQKKELPDGMWYKTPGGSIVHTRELKNNSYVCPEDDYHVRIGSKEYFEILFDNKSFQEYDADILSEDPLKFVDTKSYKERVKKTIKAKSIITNLLFVNSKPPILVIPDIHSGEYTVLFKGEKILRTACCKIKLMPKVASNVSNGLPYRYLITPRSMTTPITPDTKNAAGTAINNEYSIAFGRSC